MMTTSLPPELIFLVLQFSSSTFSQHSVHLRLNKHLHSLIVNNPQYTVEHLFRSQLNEVYEDLLNEGYTIYNEFYRPVQTIAATDFFQQYHLSISVAQKEFQKKNWRAYQQDLSHRFFKKSQNDRDSNDFRVVLHGDGGVGKSALAVRLSSGIFITEYDPTIEDEFHTYCEYQGDVYRLSMLDVAGQSEYSAMRDQYLRIADVSIVLCSVNNRCALDTAEQIIQQVQRVQDTDNVAILLVLSKIDITDDIQTSISDLEKIGNNNRISMIDYVPTSSKTGKNIDLLGEKVVKLCLQWRTEKPKPSIRVRKKQSKCLLA